MNHLFINTVSTRRATLAKMGDIGEMVPTWRPVAGLEAVSCRISPASGRRQVSVGKEQVVSTHTLFSNGEEAFLEGDLLTDEKGFRYEIGLVRVCNGMTGYHHTELDLVHRSGQEAL